MATVTGLIEQIRLHNEKSGHTIMSVTDQSDGEEVIMVDDLAYVVEDDMIEASSHMTQHSVYREQFQIESYEMKTLQNEPSIGCYLGSGAIKGIGAALVVRIVRYLKADTFQAAEEEPERLSEVKGVSEKMIIAIAERVEDKKDMRQAMMFLQNYGIAVNLAAKIYQEYDPALYGIIRENPYCPTDNIPGAGFKMADKIAERVGILADSDYHIKADILYTLLLATVNGHTYLPQTEPPAQASELLKVEPSAMEEHLMDMQIGRKVVVKPSAQGTLVYSSHHYYLELNAVCMLHDLNIKGDIPQAEIKASLLRIQQQGSIHLDELREKAVYETVNGGLLVIAGGPGTGKTTTTSTVIRYFEMEGTEVLLVVPTGRTVKRVTEATGYEVRIIYCMLEPIPVGVPGNDAPAIPGAPGSGRGAQSTGMHFGRNEESPLDADVIVIDEMSMADISLMYSLLRAVDVDTRPVLMRDADQLPSVGPRSALRDITESDSFSVVELTHVFRQAAQNDIMINAHKINAGESVGPAKRSQDSLFIRGDNPDAVISAAITLVQKRLPDYAHADASGIQIMTPVRKGAPGVEHLNQITQNYLNLSNRTKKEEEAGGTIYRVDGKVIQIKNNYQMKWKVHDKYSVPVDKGAGIFNGDVGIIREINEFAGLLTVESDEGKMIEYNFKQLEGLELVYAITIHKPQGNEYSAIIIPMHNGPRTLTTRNLIYTAVTRARACVCLMGQLDVFYTMMTDCVKREQYPGSKSRIGEIYA